MMIFDHDTAIATDRFAVAEIAVEQLTVYRYHVVLTDDVDDPEAVALQRFLAGETPDAGPAEGEQHELETFYVGEVEPERASPPTYDEWIETCRPLSNPFNPNAPFNGMMFETFGPEFDHVLAMQDARVWTIVEGDDDALLLISGRHFVNRLGYLLTEKPWDGINPIEITIE